MVIGAVPTRCVAQTSGLGYDACEDVVRKVKEARWLPAFSASRRATTAASAEAWGERGIVLPTTGLVVAALVAALETAVGATAVVGGVEESTDAELPHPARTMAPMTLQATAEVNLTCCAWCTEHSDGCLRRSVGVVCPDATHRLPR